MSIESKKKELEELRRRVASLETEVSDSRPVKPFEPQGFYTGYYATTGFMLGMFAAIASLLFNMVGSLMFGKPALQLIQVYLTFPLGDKAMEFTSKDQGMILAFGCCLYIATGMVLGALFYVALVWLTKNSSIVMRLLVATVLSLLVWVVNYYIILKYLQPALLPEMSPANYIVALVPAWVAAATHLVYGWAIALMYPLGQYVAPISKTEQA